MKRETGSMARLIGKVRGIDQCTTENITPHSKKKQNKKTQNRHKEETLQHVASRMKAKLMELGNEWCLNGLLDRTCLCIHARNRRNIENIPFVK